MRQASRRFRGETWPSASKSESSLRACSRINEHSILSVRSWNQASKSWSTSTSESAFREDLSPETPIGHDAPSLAAEDHRLSKRQFAIAVAPSPSVLGDLTRPGVLLNGKPPRATSPIRGRKRILVTRDESVTSQSRPAMGQDVPPRFRDGKATTPPPLPPSQRVGRRTRRSAETHQRPPKRQ